MIRFFRRIRQRLLYASKFSKYLFYAAGEILLVVLGILIAIQINEWNRERSLITAEKEVYDILITDLKRDSALFINYKNSYQQYLDSYFELNKLKNDGGNFNGIFTDFIVSNLEFNPVVQKNNLQIIEKLRSQQLRNKVNTYFRRLNQVEQATTEFNTLISQKSRPFFLEEHNIFNNENVFNYSDKTFPPFLRVSVIDTTRLAKTFDEKHFTPILSELRMSLGFYLIALDIAIEENQTLIQVLQEFKKE